MVEVFKYTERVVNMIRPRKLLFMAIGKHYTQIVHTLAYWIFYRRCCPPEQKWISNVLVVSDQHKRPKTRKMHVKSLWRYGKVNLSRFRKWIIPEEHISAMGKEVSDEDKNKEAWDSNAITPGTPFMDLLATSLRYWVVQKINSDPGWKNVSMFEWYVFSHSHSNLLLRCKSLFLMLVFLGRGSIR